MTSILDRLGGQAESRLDIDRNEKELILRALASEYSATYTGRPAALAFGPQSVDLDSAAAIAVDQGVIGPVTSFVEKEPEAYDTPAVGRLKRRREFLRIVAASRVAVLVRVHSMLEAQNVPVICFKGPTLSALLYGDATERQPGDLDLLVPKEDFLRAGAVLAEEGYVPTVVGRGGKRVGVDFEDLKVIVDRQNAVSFRHPTCNLDLHWSLDDYPFITAIDHDRLWKEPSFLTVAGHTLRVMEPSDLFLYLASHGAKHVWCRLVWICDVAALATKEGLDWDYIRKRADDAGEARTLRVALLLAHRLCSIPLDNRMPGGRRGDGFADYLARRAIARVFNSVQPMHAHLFRLLNYQTVSRKLQYVTHRISRVYAQ